MVLGNDWSWFRGSRNQRRKSPKDQSSNPIDSTFAACLIILAENQHPTATRLLLSCIDHIIIGRLVILLHRKGQEIRSSHELRSPSTVRRAL